MNEIKYLAMNESPGVVIKGSGTAQQLFDDITMKLFGFYQGRGLIFAADRQLFNPRIARYTHKVFEGEIPDAVSSQVDGGDGELMLETRVISAPRQYASLKVDFKGNQKDSPKYVDCWDFPHLPSQSQWEVFLLYFNLFRRDLKANKAEMDKFLRFLGV